MMDEVLQFWFVDNERAAWFEKSAEFDAEIRSRFRHTYDAAAAGTLMHWQATPLGATALLVLLDQFPRNMFRQSPKAYATDLIALAVAKYAVRQGYDHAKSITENHCRILYLPFEHSENIDDQRVYMRLIMALTDDESTLFFARRHMEIIERFGRFPHRNDVLQRQSTSEELAFLQEPHSSF